MPGDEPTVRAGAAADDPLADTHTRRLGGPRKKGAAVFAPGDKVGRLTVLDVLGEGGFGQVFAAFDDHLKRRVAVKVLYRDTDAAMQARFRREGEALATLAHPNVVAVFDVFEHEGQVVLAMEYVEGETLTAWAAQQGPRPVLGAFLQAARGLAAAHAAGLVHRDFKPDNVLIGTDGRARVADFGLAARTEEPRVGVTTEDGGGPEESSSMLDAKLSQAGMVMGTPFFMAPEVLEGERATAVSDGFSFFKALGHVFSGRARGEADGEVPPWVDTMVVRGTSARVAARYPGLDEVVRELEARLGVRPELDPRRGSRQRRALLAAQLLLGVGVMAIAIAVGGEVATRPEMLLALGVWQFAVTAGAVLLGRRALAGSVVTQRVSALVGLIVTAMLVNRALGWRWASAGSTVLTHDLVLMAVVLAAGGLFVQRWLLVASVVALVGAGSLGAAPAQAPLVFLLTVAAVIGQAFLRLREADQIRPGLITADEKPLVESGG